MKNIVVLGCGLVGRAIAVDLASHYNVVVVEKDEGRLSRVYNIKNLAAKGGDIYDESFFKEVISEADLVVGALPGFMGFETLRRVIEEGKDIVDISFFGEDPFMLDSLAKEKNVTAVVDCGIAPGLSSIMLGHHSTHMDISSYRCYVGGLPFKRDFPFEYKAAFSPSDVIEEYTRDARFVKDGIVVIKEALSDPEAIDFKDVGTLEAFDTDGLRSLVQTMKIPNMIEKTLRYPKHIEYINVLKSAGFFSKDQINLGNTVLRPIDVTSKLLFSLWQLKENEPEFTVLRVIINGNENKKEVGFTYDLFDQYDEQTGNTSMARTTGFTCNAVVNLILQNKFNRKGICPPEYVGMEPGCFDFVTNYLKERNVTFEVTKK